MKRKSSLRNFLVPLLAPVAVLGLLFAASTLDLSQQLENVTVDWRFKAREPHDPAADPRILLVGIGEYSLKQRGRWQDWTRAIHGEFLEAVNPRTPAVVAYDFFFSEPSSDSSDDEVFISGLENFFGSAVTGAVADTESDEGATYDAPAIGNTKPLERFKGDYDALLHARNGSVPIAGIAQSSWTGFVNTPPSRIDGIRRRIPLVIGFGGRVYPSLVLQILMQFDGVRVEDVEVTTGDAVRLERGGAVVRRIPIDEQGFMSLNYRGGKAFDPVDYVELIEKLRQFENADWPATLPRIDGRIMIVGQMAEGLADFGRTPFAPLEPLVLVQAVALNTILQSDYLRMIPLWQVLLGWLPLAWGTLFFLRKSPVFWGVAIPITIVVAYIAIAFLLFWQKSWQLPLFLPVLGFLVVNGHALTDRIVLEMRAKSRIKNLFGTYVSPEVVESMVNSGEDPKLGGQTAEITAFFSDVQSFSTFSEKLDAERLVALMIDYLTAMTDILVYRGGTLDKYIGDAIVGMFGAPLHFPDHAHRACSATIEMQRRQGELREKWRSEGGWPDIVYQMQTRIGLNTGPAVIGNMGSPRRFNYTMMGDTVNLAARCESGAKSYGVYTMVTGETRAGAVAVKDDIAFRYLDKIVVKGRSQPAEIFEVLGFAAELPQATSDCIGIYEQGIARYLARDWDRAREAFERSAKLEPHQPGILAGCDTNPSLVMIDRAGKMKANPPADDWDGRYVMTSK